MVFSNYWTYRTSIWYDICVLIGTKIGPIFHHWPLTNINFSRTSLDEERLNICGLLLGLRLVQGWEIKKNLFIVAGFAHHQCRFAIEPEFIWAHSHADHDNGKTGSRTLPGTADQRRQSPQVTCPAVLPIFLGVDDLVFLDILIVCCSCKC